MIRRVIAALKSIKRKDVSLEMLSRRVGIYPDVLADSLVYFSPMIRMDPDVNCRDFLEEMKEYVKEPFAEKKPRKQTTRVPKAEMRKYVSIADFCYKKMTSVGGLVDTSIELSDMDLEILKRLVAREIQKRKKEEKAKEAAKR